MIINLSTPLSDDKEMQRRNEVILAAIEQYTEERMNDAYGRIHTDGSRSGGQPRQSNVFDACDVQKHTLIVEQDYASHTIKVKSLKDSQPTQSDALRDQLLQECLVKLRDVQGMEAPKQYACNLIKRIERVLQEQSK